MAKTVGNLIDEVHVLLQDVIPGSYRYPEEDIVIYLGDAFLEIRRVRPDLVRAFFRTDFPTFQADVVGKAVTIPIDPQFYTAVRDYVLSMCQLRDDENNQDSRSMGFRQMFLTKLTTAVA